MKELKKYYEDHTKQNPVKLLRCSFFFLQKAVNFLFSQKSSILDIRVGLEVMNKIYEVKAIQGSPVANV